MAFRELVGGMADGSTVKRVFGNPIEKNGVLVIPVASIGGGFGGGEGPAPAGDGSGEGSTEGAAGKQWGGGGMWSAKPTGVYVLRDGEVTWVPAVDQNRAILLGMLTGIVSLLILRSIVRSALKRG
jgi:uncharacterized spore protein YtfJ